MSTIPVLTKDASPETVAKSKKINEFYSWFDAMRSRHDPTYFQYLMDRQWLDTSRIVKKVRSQQWPGGKSGTESMIEKLRRDRLTSTFAGRFPFPLEPQQVPPSKVVYQEWPIDYKMGLQWAAETADINVTPAAKGVLGDQHLRNAISEFL